MRRIYNKSIYILLISIFIFSCKSDRNTNISPVVEEKKEIIPVQIPGLNADSAYAFIEKQVSFGPRNPNSPGHQNCKEWIVSKLDGYGLDVEEQSFTANLYTGDQYTATNIIGRYKPDATTRVLLAAHWDTRFHADKDENVSIQNEPILGADDGGSGTAVLLEIARQLSLNPIELGVDFVFFDAEDQGNSDEKDQSATWCIGSNHWSREAVKNNYKAKYGILLDMVGARGATFPREGGSIQFAEPVLNEVWNLANKMGYSNFFVKTRTNPIQDDHIPVNVIAKIPMIDIINIGPKENGISFGDHWHTHNDNLDIIDKKTLKAAGQVTLAAIYKTYSGEILN